MHRPDGNPIIEEKNTRKLNIEGFKKRKYVLKTA